MNDFIIPYRRYVDFSGRSDRKEFWYYLLFYVIVAAMLSVVDRTLFPHTLDGDGDYLQPLTSIFAIGSLVPSIAVSIRRMHDTGRSGWWVLIWLIPIIGWIWALVLCAQKGQPEPNAYGEPPEGSRAV